LEDDVNIDDVSATLRRDLITSDTVRFSPVNSLEKPIHDIVAGIDTNFLLKQLSMFLVSFPRQ
jgi:hypothetical protein